MSSPAPASLIEGLACPACQSPLRSSTTELRCVSCGRTYPVLLGIPDLRLEPDPWIATEDDRAKGLRLDEAYPDADVDALVRAYWEMTPGTPPHLKARFTQHVLEGELRAEELLATEGGVPVPAGSAQWLDLGCGTGEFSTVAARAGATVTGLDVAFRWLVVARRRVSVAGIHVRLICGNAERLPFPSQVFTRVMALGVLEHCRRPVDVLAEIRRVLRPGGIVVIRTVNRYSLLSEPHVGIWGVGYVPRRWADAYVQWRTGGHYLHHRPLSSTELRRLMRGVGFRDVSVGPAPLLERDRSRLPSALRGAAAIYEAARRWPLFTHLIGSVSPLLEARGTVT